VSLELLCPFAQLTPRESDVARLLLRSYSNKEIGGVLGIPRRNHQKHLAAHLQEMRHQFGREANQAGGFAPSERNLL